MYIGEFDHLPLHWFELCSTGTSFQEVGVFKNHSKHDETNYDLEVSTPYKVESNGRTYRNRIRKSMLLIERSSAM